jgi:tetratricopeptide (TPR) repeat protein
MKYGPHIFPVFLIPALIGLGAAFRPKVAEHRVAGIETTIECGPTTIECGPSTTEPLPDAKGKFIPLLPGLGHHTYQISSEQDSARLFFNQGLNLYYSYHLQEALASFKEAARFDSAAAMTYWGQALAMGPYYNSYSYKMRAGVPAAVASMSRHRSTATEKEKGLIDAMQQRYSSDFTNADRSHLDSAYARQMSALVARYPADDDIKALYIDAVMLQHKWDFWHTDRTPKQWTPGLIALCQTILKKEPHHPAALHYYIHLTEASGEPELALAGADILKNDMPGVGHMVHMASHMYQRNGLFVRGVTDNENANTAYNLEDSLAPALGLGRNNVIHVFAVQSYCAMTAGMYRQGMPVYMRTRDRLVATRPVFEKEPYSQFIYMLPVMALVRLGKWDEIMQAPMPDHQWKYATILAHFARGMANVRLIDLRAATADLDSLQTNLADSLLGVRMMPFDKPSQCGSIAAGILRGEILFAEGKQDEAVNSLTRAVEEEDALIYREPQQWLIPVRQYLGVVLLKMHEPGVAEKVYRTDLFRNPGNGWSLLGLYQCLLAQQKLAEAQNIKTKYHNAFASCDVNPVTSAF